MYLRKLTLKQARMLREKTQEDMAKVGEIHVQTYRKIEKKPELATIQQATKFANFLDMEYDEIFFTDNSSLNRVIA